MAFFRVPGAEVRGHDDDRVLEVDRAPLGVGETTVLEDLQQRVEDVGVGLLDLVEQHHRERLATHGLGELATLVVADVSGRGTDEATHRVLLHVLGHVELDEGVLVAEQELGQRLGGLGLAHPRGAEEDERAGRALGSLRPARVRRIALDTATDGVVLADDPLVQLVLHVDETGRLLLGEAMHGDAGPLGEHLGDLLFVDDPAGLATGLAARPRRDRQERRSWSRSWAARSYC
jgi:hypothetical protein